MNKKERINRVIARGEGSNHSHVITGDATITRNKDGEILITWLENQLLVAETIIKSNS